MLAELAGRGEDGIGQRTGRVGGMAGAGHIDRDFAGAGGDLQVVGPRATGLAVRIDLPTSS